MGRSARTLGSAVFAGGAVSALLLAAIACQDPTQVRVTITTGDGVCAALSSPTEKHTEVFAGSPGDPPSEARGRVDGCPGAELGTVTPVPSERGGDVPPEVAMALAPGKAPGDCRADAKGCIVARRRVGYVSHRSLSLQVPLDRSCIGVSCDPASTCFAGGCRPAEVVCQGSSCELSGSDAGPPVEAGPPVADAEPTPDATIDAGACPKLPAGAERVTSLGSTLVYVPTGGTSVHTLDPLGKDQIVIGAFDATEPILALAAGGGDILAATRLGIYQPPGITKVTVPSSTVERLAMTNEIPTHHMWLSSGTIVFGPSGAPQIANGYTGILGGKSTFFVANDSSLQEYNTAGGIVGVPFVVAPPPQAMAPALGGKLYWSDGASLRVGSVNPPKADFTEPIADVVALGASGDWVALAARVDVSQLPGGPTGWGFDVRVTRLTASGFSPPVSLGLLRGAGAVPATVDLAVVGPCVYGVAKGQTLMGRLPF